MRLAIFVDKFPVLSQTFVINQITGLIDLGVDVSIISLNQAEVSQTQHPIVIQYHLLERTIYLNKEHNNKFIRATNRLVNTCIALLTPNKRKKVLTSFTNKFGHHGKSLLLSTIIAKQSAPLCADVILCHFGYNGVAANKLRELGVIKGKIATIFHGYEISAYKAIENYRKDYITLFNYTELMLPISELWQRKLIDLGCPITKIKVHRMGVDLGCFTFNKHIKTVDNSKNEKDSSIFKLFTVARFTEKKGLEYAIKAIALLPDNFKIRYVIAGYGELENDLKALVNNLKITDKVEFVGPLDQTQITKYMNNCDAFIQPSITAKNGDMEGVPVAIMEAMAIGLPIISTYHSGIPELIVDRKHGLLSPEKNEKNLCDNILLLSMNYKLRDQLVKNARLQIEKIADVSKLNKSLIDILKCL